jgi:hypothetical protein
LEFPPSLSKTTIRNPILSERGGKRSENHVGQIWEYRQMKHGKKPTREQRKLMQKWKVNTYDWLVERETPTELVLVHRHFDKKTKIVPKGVKGE